MTPEEEMNQYLPRIFVLKHPCRHDLEVFFLALAIHIFIHDQNSNRIILHKYTT